MKTTNEYNHANARVIDEPVAWYDDPDEIRALVEDNEVLPGADEESED